MKSIRDQRQEECARMFMDSSHELPRGILNLCPRFGKCRVAILILRMIEDTGIHNPKVLIAYPNLQVEESWKEEFKKMKYKNPNVIFTTHVSLHKYISKDYDLVILDECHLLSEKQRAAARTIQRTNRVLGLTGTLDKWTEIHLEKESHLWVISRYSIRQGVEEGVITDYEITIKEVSLDDKEKKKYKTATRTEKEQFDAYGKVIEKMTKVGTDPFYLRLARMRVIQASKAKIKATKDLLQKFQGERVLTFCGLIKSAEALGCPVFHSKSKSNAAFEKFAKGKGDHLAVVKIGNTGITYKPLDRVVINYFDSNPENMAQKINRCMGLESWNPGKKADIWIVSSDEEVEQKWLERALAFFDPHKIKYIR